MSRWTPCSLMHALVLTALACGSHDESPALSIPVKSSEPMNLAELNTALQQQTIVTGVEPSIQALDAASRVTKHYVPAERQGMSVSRLTAETYKATIVLSGIPDDDSVAGYWYQLVLKQSAAGGWTITDARHSWQCWPDRGHADFSVEHCR